MALDKTQREILESLLKQPQTIKELISSTGYSDTNIRQNLKLLVHDKELILDKARQPYLYSVAPNSPELFKRKKVDDVKAALMTHVDNEEELHPLIKMVRRGRRESWPDMAMTMLTISQAIEELEADGMLISTLEVR